MLTFFHHDSLRAPFQNPLRTLHEICFFRELSKLGIVQRDEIDVSEQRDEIIAAALDPEVHRVAGNETRFVYLLQDFELKTRVNVAEEDVLRALKLVRGDLRPEMREHPQTGLERVSAELRSWR